MTATTRLGWLFVAGKVSPMWPASGLGLAFLVVWGWRAWPALAAGVLLGELITRSPLHIKPIGILPNLLAPAVAYWWLRRAGEFRLPVESPKQLFRWGLAGLVQGLAGGVIGTAVQFAAGVRLGPFWVAVRNWALSDALSVIVGGTLVLTLLSPRRGLETPRRRLEFGLALATAVAMSRIAFTGLMEPSDYVWTQHAPLPVLVWLGLRFGLPGAAVGSLILACVAIWHVMAGTLPLGVIPVNQMILMLQAAIAVPACTSLAIAAVLEDRNRKEAALRASEVTLRQSEATLRQSEATLRQSEAKTRQLLESEATLRRDAQAANQAKSDFLANVSHEIRTPMSGILGLVNLALATPRNEKQEEYLEGVRFSAESLLHLLNDILDSSKIEAGKLEMAPVEFVLRDTIHGVVSGLRSAAEAKGLVIEHRIEESLPERCYGDDLRLRQILVNLLHNAIKFTERGSVVIRAGAEEGREGMIRFSVQDTGIGIPAEALERLFRPFEQADGSTTRKYGGTGLGLSISARLTEMMGGRMWAESAPGAGSTFYFTAMLPGCERGQEAVAAGNGAADACVSGGQAPARGAGLHVLIAEDNRINRQVITALLEQVGHRVSSVHNGVEAVAAAGSGHYDCIFMDVQMPEMDGIEATRLLREAGVGVPIFALTARAMEDDERLCLEAGMTGFLVKPIDPRRLGQALAQVPVAPVAGLVRGS